MRLSRNKPSPGTVPALFLHIQKTAGTSIVHLARQFYGEGITSHGECWGRNPEELKHIGFVSGHIGYHFARPLMENRYAFTFLRDPAERILSMYYFCHGRNPDEFEIYQKARELDLVGFLEAGLTDHCVRKNIWNNQVWQLAHGYAHLDDRSIEDFGDAELLELAKTHLAQFSYVGFTETFDADAAVILRALGLPKVKRMPRMNASPERPEGKALSSEIKARLDELTVLDRALYDYAWTQFPAARRKNRGGWW
jgi:hypothetical protein